MQRIGFKEWIMSEQFKKTRLSVFDFDGTVANVPEKPDPSAPTRGWTGKDWWGSRASLTPPHEGGFYEGGVNHEVVDAFKEAKADPNTHAILLTGRRGVAAPYVRRVLRDNGLFGKRMVDPNSTKAQQSFDNQLGSQKDVLHPDEDNHDGHEEYYTGDHTGHENYPTTYSKKKKKDVPDGGTLAHKKHVIESLVKGNDGFDVVEIWDDRLDHLESFKKIGEELMKSGLVKQYLIHQVYPPANPHGQATIKHIDLGKGYV